MRSKKNRSARCDEVEFEELKEAKRRNDVIQKYLDKEITYKSALGLIPCSKTTFYKLIHKYDESSGSTALIPTKRGRKKGESQLSEAVENIIRDSIKSKLTSRVAGPSGVWKRVKDRCIESNLPIPSLGSVAKRVHSIELLSTASGIWRVAKMTATASSRE